MNMALKCMILLFLVSCSNTSAQSGTPPEVQNLIDKTLKQMIFVEGGSFMMGDPGQPFADILGGDAFRQYFTAEDNIPVHKVILDSYYMGAYEVPYIDYDIYSYATKTPIVGKNIRKLAYIYSPQRPVGVSWYSARNYCQWLAEETGLPFSLPSEAQWEFAARNRGKTVVFATDNGKIEQGVNFPSSTRYPIESGKFPPNPLGFYDLSGNAYEWVNDWYEKDYYSYSPENNPQGPETGLKKVARGGGGVPDSTTVARRGSRHLNENYPGMGFRCVINTDKPLPIKK